jgi:outer membrane protein with beta-barrel domain
MLRKIALICGLIFVFSFAAHAQDSDKVEVFGGYSYLRFDNSPSFNQNGWEVSGQYKFRPWLGAVADFSGDYGKSTHTTYFMFGPQVSWPARVSPFGHVLIGGAHVSSSFTEVLDPPTVVTFSSSDTSFAVAIGGGIDAKIVGPFHWRVFQGDWIHSSVFGTSQNNARISTGIVIKF